MMMGMPRARDQAVVMVVVVVVCRERYRRSRENRHMTQPHRRLKHHHQDQTQYKTADENEPLTAEEDESGDIIGGTGDCDSAAAIAATFDGACCPGPLPGEDNDPPAVGGAGKGEDCAVVTTVADIPLLLMSPTPPTASLFDCPLVSTGIIAVSGNRLSPGPPGVGMGGRAPVLSPELFIPGSLGNGA